MVCGFVRCSLGVVTWIRSCVQVFCTAYRHVDPGLYTSMQHLFWTWRGVFPPVPLRTIEAELQLNPKPGGPATGNQPPRAMEPSVRPGHGIHVNPKYLEQRQLLQQSRTSRVCISYLPYFDICWICSVCVLEKRNLPGRCANVYGRQMLFRFWCPQGVVFCCALC